MAKERKKEYPQITALIQQSSLIIILIAFATYVASLATPVAGLTGRIGAVTSDVPRLVAIVAGWAWRCWIGAIPSNMACLVAIVTWWITGALLTIPGDVSGFVAAVTPILVLLTLTCKVAKAVTLVAFLLASTAFISSSTTTRSSFWTFSCKVTSAIAPIAHTRTHLDILETKNQALLLQMCTSLSLKFMHVSHISHAKVGLANRYVSNRSYKIKNRNPNTYISTDATVA